MPNPIFKTIYFLLLVLISGVRTLSTYKYRKLSLKEDRSTKVDLILLFFSGLGMITPLVYIFTSWFDFANYHLPDIVGWIGAILFACASGLLWMTHRALDKNWTPTLGFRENHSLITTGIYKYIRHPMYGAHLLWAIAQPLLLHNWIAGYSFLLAALPQYLMRVGDEEKMMLDKFGDDYQEYMKGTGRLFPKL